MIQGKAGAGKVSVGVCGTTFGQVYLEALRRTDSPFELGGILARGSERSRVCADHYGTQLFSDVDEFAGRIDVACVVVRSGLLGGRGTELARKLMDRGVHVLQEHPVHQDELSECLRSARANGVVYRLNSFYVNLTPVRRFIAAARELFRVQPPLYADAACGFQVAYALLDILGRAFGKVRPWAFVEPVGRVEVQWLTQRDVPFRSIDGAIAGVPLSLRLQNQIDPSDPDNHAHLLHRITLGSEGGNLTLVTTHGPIVWSARPQIPSRVRDPTGAPLFRSPQDLDDAATATVLGPVGVPGHRSIFASLWPEAALKALTDLHRAILLGEDPLRRGLFDLALARVWHELTARLGPPDQISGELPRPLPPDALLALSGAARASEATS